MEGGVVAKVLFRENGTFEVEEIMEKSRGSVREAGRLIAQAPGDDSAGSQGSYAKIVLE